MRFKEARVEKMPVNSDREVARWVRQGLFLGGGAGVEDVA